MTHGLFIFSGGHWYHKELADIIGYQKYFVGKHSRKEQHFIEKGKNLIVESMAIPHGYDVYLTEGCYYYPALKKTLGLLNARIINFNSSPLLYWLLTGRIRGIEKKFLLSLAKKVDGYLVSGRYGVEILKRVGIDKPYLIIYPFIRDNTFCEMSKVRPELGGHSLVTIANIDWFYKGIDILLESFDKVCERYPDSQLFIIGNIKVPQEVLNKCKNIKRVHFLGYVDNIGEVFSKCSLYLQPSRGETFSISALEAMCAGLPVIVSDETGCKEVVEKLDKRNVVPLCADKISERIIEYFEMPQRMRRAHSDRARRLAKHFRKSIITKGFKQRFEKFVSSLK